MKTTFSIFFIATLSLLSTTSAVIYDSSGNKLIRGIPYYVLPLLRGSGGGLTVSQSHTNSCPLNVTQEFFEVNNGVPFTFNPVVLDEHIIREAYPVSIEADVFNPCTGSKIWKVTSVDKLLTKKDHKKKHDDEDDDDDDDKDVVPVHIVTTNGEFNKPESCFQIVEDNMMPGLISYQIQNCPFKCGSSSTGLVCYNIGVLIDADGNRYLGRTDAVFPVVFTNSYGHLFYTYPLPVSHYGAFLDWLGLNACSQINKTKTELEAAFHQLEASKDKLEAINEDLLKNLIVKDQESKKWKKYFVLSWVFFAVIVMFRLVCDCS